MSKGLSFSEARKLSKELEQGLILRPDEAKVNELRELQSEWSNVWQLRDTFLGDALTGGCPPTVATLDAAEELAKETMRRRLKDVIGLAEASGAPIGRGARYVATVLGVEMPEAKRAAQSPETALVATNEGPKLVTAH